MINDSIISWLLLDVGALVAGLWALVAFVKSRPAPRKDYGTVKSAKINLDWGK